MDLHGPSRTFADLRGPSWTFVDLPGLSRAFVDLRGLFPDLADLRRLSRTFDDLRRLSRTFADGLNGMNATRLWGKGDSLKSESVLNFKSGDMQIEMLVTTWQ
eukprot:Phypoly_transcript_16898.p1 GENE.Phypoly_transcript_16898~~Phypoly_transcript_16898.p1  ORF type:complete len:103 (-),score=1.04 Phypoly_transcript_16898:212-520(-)